jgi:hypothetical protein
LGRSILPTISWGGGPLEEWWRGPFEAPRTPPPCCAWSPSPANAGEDNSPARLAPSATRERFAATRLTTLLFYFCSLSRESEQRVNRATRDRLC